MKLTVLWCVCAVVVIQTVCSKGIPLSGSKNCQLSVRFATNPVFTKYHSLEIVNTHTWDPRYSLRGCHVVSVKMLTALSHKTSMFNGNLVRFTTKQDDNKLKLTLPLRQPVLDASKVKVAIELDCNGKRCVLYTSLYNVKNNDDSQPYLSRRKLLATDINIDPKKSSMPFFHLFFAVAVILALVITLAMCTCGGNSRVEKTLSDEVGGTDFHQHVIGVSRTQVDEENKESELPQNGSNERRNTSNSKNRSSVASRDYEEVNETTRTASQSSQQGDLLDKPIRLESNSSQSSSKVFHSSGSHGSIDKMESEVLLKTDNSEQIKNKVRSASTEENSSSNSNSKGPRSLSHSDGLVYKGNEANIATSNKKSNTVQLISRKHSDKKNPKVHGDGREDHKGKRNWLRRKSSKNKSNIESQVSADNKRKSPTPGRHSAIPLPPTPETKDFPAYIEEDNQYEAVEPRPRQAAPLPDNSYDSVVDVKGNSTHAKNSRPASELYESIDSESKMKRNFSQGPEYDIVETKPKPHPADSSNLEYAYTVVAARDTLAKPVETSGGSGLYEVVTDDIKKLSGVKSTDDTYAVVQKDSSKTLKQQTRPLSDSDLVPAPPPVSSLRHVAVSSGKRRVQSEGEDINITSDDESSAHLLEGPKEVDHTYAKVNKSLKKRSVNSEALVGEIVISDGVDDDDDKPPPIPPSLYAELPVKDEEMEGLNEDAEAAPTIEINVVPADSDLQDIDAPTSQSSKRNSRGSVNNDRNSKNSTDITVFNNDSSTQVTSQENIVVTVDSDSKTSSADKQTSDINPLYQVIHYV